MGQSRAQNVLTEYKNPGHSPRDGGTVREWQGKSAIRGLERQNGLKD